MIHTDARFASAVEAKVAEIERTTDAELVVVACERATPWRGVRAWVGAALALAALVAILFLPHPFAPGWVVVDGALAFVLGERIAGWRPLLGPLVRALPRHAAAHAVEQAANQAFTEDVVHGTPRRTGLLVFVAALEGRIVLRPDLGVDAVVPRGELARAHAAFAHDDLDGFLAGLDALGRVLAARLPHRPDSDATDLPNAPRVRP